MTGVERLEAVAVRLGDGDVGDEDVPLWVTDYENIIKTEVAAVTKACNDLGIPQVADIFQRAYANNLGLIQRAPNTKKPKPQELMAYLKPGIEAIQAADTLRYKGASITKWGEHYKAMYEAVMVVSWVTMAPPNDMPAQHVEGQVQSCDFHLTRIQRREKDPKTKAWLDACRALNKKVETYVSVNFKNTGLTFNPKHSILKKGSSLNDTSSVKSTMDDQNQEAVKNASKKPFVGGQGIGDALALLNKGIDITKGVDQHTLKQNVFKTLCDTYTVNVTCAKVKADSCAKERLRKLLLWLRNWFLISIPSFAFFGCQLSWALQGSFVTPHLESLDAPEKYISYIWLASPISGIILQPLIGFLSDNMSHQQRQKYGGRRRPFIIIGFISIVICLLLFSNAKYITQNIFSSNSTSIALIIACISFCILDISTNIVQATLRALISDIIPVQYLKQANGLFGFQHSFGGAFAFFLGFSISSNSNSGGNISLVFGFSAVIIFIAGLITFLCTNKNEQMFAINMERNLSSVAPSPSISGAALLEDTAEQIKIFINDEKEFEERILEMHISSVKPSRSSFAEICNLLKNMPKPILYAFVVQFFAYIGLFSTQIYLTDWFGREIMGGSPETYASQNSNDLYNSGTKYANIGLFFMAIFSMPFSLCLPSLMNKYGYRYMYSICLFLFGVVLISFKFINKGSIVLAIILIASNFPIWSATQIIGWSIVSDVIAGDMNDKSAIYTTLFNLSNCLPEILVAVVLSPIVYGLNGNTGFVLFSAGIACVIGSIFCLCFLIEPKDWLRERNSRKQSLN